MLSQLVFRRVNKGLRMFEFQYCLPFQRAVDTSAPGCAPMIERLSRRKKLGLAFLVALLLLIAAGTWALWWFLPGVHRVDRDWTLPTSYNEDRFYVEPVAVDGQKFHLLTDTGGGLMLSRGAVERCGLPIKKLLGRQLTRLPRFRSDAWIPEPTHAEHWISIADGNDNDGMLGQRWFAGGIWTFDYRNRFLLLRRRDFSPGPEQARHAAPLHFRTEFGMRVQNHPRLIAQIGGEAISALFDTGATTFLTPEALRLINDSHPSERATSFAAATLFESWHRRHPEWRLIDNAEKASGSPMIEVPEIEVAGLKAGPVWFTRRSDAGMQWMSKFMDQPISASLGGDFLRYFTITVDYPGSIAFFERDATLASPNRL